MIRGGFWLGAVAAATVVVGVAGSACGQVAERSPAASRSTIAARAVTSAPGSVHVAAVGDIAASDDADAAVAQEVSALGPDALLLLGDIAYPRGSSSDFAKYFTPDWEQFSGIWSPVPGNHEYKTAGAAGYREYFAESGGLYWTHKLGSWRVIGLDSEKPKSAKQLSFLRSTLKRYDKVPTLVIWHRPRYSSGPHGDQPDVSRLWNTVKADPDVQLVLWGHDHDYERMAIPVAGRQPVTAMIVGTGGGDLRPTPALPDRTWRKKFIDHTYGVLDLQLDQAGFRWRFIRDDGEVLDSGSSSIG